MELITQIGKLITETNPRRDAIHVAVAPAFAVGNLEPGNHVGFAFPDDIESFGLVEEYRRIGIVDPFLTETIHHGQRFWVFLYPGSISGLRHTWTHPAFAAASAAVTNRARS